MAVSSMSPVSSHAWSVSHNDIPTQTNTPASNDYDKENSLSVNNNNINLQGEPVFTKNTILVHNNEQIFPNYQSNQGHQNQVKLNIDLNMGVGGINGVGGASAAVHSFDYNKLSSDSDLLLQITSNSESNSDKSSSSGNVSSTLSLGSVSSLVGGSNNNNNNSNNLKADGEVEADRLDINKNRTCSNFANSALGSSNSSSASGSTSPFGSGGSIDTSVSNWSNKDNDSANTTTNINNNISNGGYPSYKQRFGVVEEYSYGSLFPNGNPNHSQHHLDSYSKQQHHHHYNQYEDDYNYNSNYNHHHSNNEGCVQQNRRGHRNRSTSSPIKNSINSNHHFQHFRENKGSGNNGVCMNFHNHTHNSCNSNRDCSHNVNNNGNGSLSNKSKKNNRKHSVQQLDFTPDIKDTDSFLRKTRLHKYIDNFAQQGITLETLLNVTEADHLEKFGVTASGARKRLFLSLLRYKIQSKYWESLREHGLMPQSHEPTGYSNSNNHEQSGGGNMRYNKCHNKNGSRVSGQMHANSNSSGSNQRFNGNGSRGGNSNNNVMTNRSKSNMYVSNKSLGQDNSNGSNRNLVNTNASDGHSSHHNHHHHQYPSQHINKDVINYGNNSNQSPSSYMSSSGGSLGLGDKYNDSCSSTNDEQAIEELTTHLLNSCNILSNHDYDVDLSMPNPSQHSPRRHTMPNKSVRQSSKYISNVTNITTPTSISTSTTTTATTNTPNTNTNIGIYNNYNIENVSNNTATIAYPNSRSSSGTRTPTYEESSNSKVFKNAIPNVINHCNPAPRNVSASSTSATLSRNSSSTSSSAGNSYTNSPLYGNNSNSRWGSGLWSFNDGLGRNTNVTQSHSEGYPLFENKLGDL